MSKSCTPKPRYRTTNWSSYNAELKSQGSLTIWLDKHMQWFTAASGKLGHSPKFSDAAIQCVFGAQELFGLALRQSTGLEHAVLQLCGLTSPVPDFSTLCRRQLDLSVQAPYTRSQTCPSHAVWIRRGLSSWAGEWK